MYEKAEIHLLLLFCCILQACDIENKLILETFTISSILVTGDIPTLLSNDEVDGLLEIIIYHVATGHVIAVLC